MKFIETIKSYSMTQEEWEKIPQWVVDLADKYEDSDGDFYYYFSDTLSHHLPIEQGAAKTAILITILQ